MNKKAISILFVAGVFLLASAQVSAQWSPPDTPAGGLEVTEILNGIMNLVWVVAAGLSVIMGIVAGILFMTANGEPSQLTKARTALIWTTIGLVVAIAAFSIVGIVDHYLGAVAS